MEREEKKYVLSFHHHLLSLVPIILHWGPGLRYAEPWKSLRTRQLSYY